MDNKRNRAARIWLGLSLSALAVAGLLAQLHRQQALDRPGAVDAAPAAQTVLQPMVDPGLGAPASPAEQRLHPRRGALSMPYFSFARLLRPGS